MISTGVSLVLRDTPLISTQLRYRKKELLRTGRGKGGGINLKREGLILVEFNNGKGKGLKIRPWGVV